MSWRGFFCFWIGLAEELEEILNFSFVSWCLADLCIWFVVFRRSFGVNCGCCRGKSWGFFSFGAS